MRHIGDWFGLGGEDGGRRIEVLGCPFDGAATGPSGSARGPDAIRAAARTQEAIDEHGNVIAGLGVVDRGDVQVAGDSPRAAILAAATKLLATSPDLLLGLGGDHAVTVPLVSAVAERWPGLAFVMLDAHADLFPEYDGDPDSHACTVARLWEGGGVAPDATALVGLRSWARPELAGVRRAGMVVAAPDWIGAGSAELGNRLSQFVGQRPVYLSIDIDVLDPAAAPGTGYPVAGGPTSRQLLDLLATFVPPTRLVGLDLVEVAPPLDRSGITAAAAAHILLQVFAGLHRGGSAAPECG